MDWLFDLSAHFITPDVQFNVQLLALFFYARRLGGLYSSGFILHGLYFSALTSKSERTVFFFLGHRRFCPDGEEDCSDSAGVWNGAG